MTISDGMILFNLRNFKKMFINLTGTELQARKHEKMYMSLKIIKKKGSNQDHTLKCTFES